MRLIRIQANANLQKTVVIMTTIYDHVYDHLSP